MHVRGYGNVAADTTIDTADGTTLGSPNSRGIRTVVSTANDRLTLSRHADPD